MKRIELDVDNLVRLYEGGESVLALSRKFGVDRSVIYRRLKERNVGIRGVSEANTIRMAKLTPEERMILTANAHAAVRGVPRSEEELIKRARNKEAAGGFDSPAEERLANLIGMNVTPQKAVGKYNVDFALNDFPIAVEVFGGSWHAFGRHANRFRKRFDLIIDSGFTPVIVWTDKIYPIGIGAAQYIISLTKALRLGKPIGRQEHVIRGDGKATPRGKSNLDYRASVGGNKCPDISRGDDGRFSN